MLDVPAVKCGLAAVSDLSLAVLLTLHDPHADPTHDAILLVWSLSIVQSEARARPDQHVARCPRDMACFVTRGGGAARWARC
jgi:hypothetical protein